MAGAQTSTWDDVAWSHSSAQKSKRPHPGTQILSQIPEGGEGNRGQMPHICPGFPPPPPPPGLTLIDALVCVDRFNRGLANFCLFSRG